MSLKDANRAKGSIQDVTKLTGLSSDAGHILCVSERTLYLLANYAQNEVAYLGRYAKSFADGGMYSAVEEGDAQEIDVLEIANRFALEVQPVCEEIVVAIGDITGELNGIKTEIGALSLNLTYIRQSVDTISATNGCCSPTGENAPPVAPDLGDPGSEDPPEDWETWTEYWTYKCRAANRIADDWIATLNGLATLSGVAGAIGAIALGLLLNTSLLGGLVVGLIAIGFSAAAAAAIAITALIAIILGGVGLLAYFAQIGSEMEANKEDLVCALFYATSPENANQIVVDFTADIAADLDYDPGDDDALFQAQATVLVDAIFNPALTNLLFELDEDTDGYEGTVDCDDCSLGLLIETSGTVDTGRAIYDAAVSGGMVDYTTHWTHEGPNNQWNGMYKGTEPEDPPFPPASPYTLWVRVRYEYFQPDGRGGWMGHQIVQSSNVKYNGRFVCGAGCYGSWNSIDDTFSCQVSTLFPGADPIQLTIAAEKDNWMLRNVIWEWVEEPV
jgi:hypothetical protein